MNDEKLLDKIRSSSDNIEVPEGLRPDAIRKKLEQEETQKSSPRFPLYRWGGAVAAALVLLVGIWGITQAGWLHPAGGDAAAEDMSAESMDESTEEIASANISENPAEADENASEAASSETAATEKQQATAFAPVGSYKELYDSLKQNSYNYYTEDYIMEDAIEEYTTSSNADTEAANDVATYESDSAVPQTNETASNHSKTNVQVEGVDEGDIVKTDGTYIYVLSQNHGIRIINADTMKVVRVIPLEDYNESVQEMYLDGDQLQIIAVGTKTNLESHSSSVYQIESVDTTTVYTYDVSNPPKAVLSGQVSQSGYYQSSRKSGDYLYLFTNYYPSIPDNYKLYEEYVPSAGGTLLGKNDLFIPEICTSSNYLVMTSVNVRQPDKIVDSKSVLSGAENFYVSSQHIFIANSEWRNDGQITQLMSFAYKNGKITAEAAGSVKGYINNSFSLDEYQNHLRVVTTCWDESSSMDLSSLFVLNEDLEIVGKIGDLAPDESIQSARFLGDTGYFVTYRQTDPLFSVDLSDPANPKILGELKITGFSEYLHFYDENLLLGIGWETDPDSGDTLGLKMSMFDISDPSNVKEKDKLIIEGVYSCPAMENYKAVMIDTKKNLFGFAYQGRADGYSKTISSSDKIISNYSLFSYDKKKGFTNLFTYSLDQESQQDIYSSLSTTRGLYIKDNFYLSTASGLTSFDMKKEFQIISKITW